MKAWIGRLMVAACLALAATAGFKAVQRAPDSSGELWQPLPGAGRGAFVAAHPTFGAAVNSFFRTEPDPVQPIAFPHNVHLAKGLQCTVCHTGVSKGPAAGLPSAQRCLLCHRRTARDHPEIQRLTQMVEEGFDIPWQRVYAYPPESHVRFSHAPHIRNEIECATCHGDLATQTVARRATSLTMGFCVDCHRQRDASLDCLTCHY